MGHSGAARAGMLNLTKTMALEWAHAGIRVNAVAPGWVATSGFDKYPDWMTERIVNLRNFVPLKRHGTESEVSAAITFLLSEGAAFISGSCIRVDGAAPQVRADWTLIDHRNSKPFNGFHLAALPKVLQGTGAEDDDDTAAD